MPINKHSFARYQVIDACIRNRQRSYPDIRYLMERCSKRLDQQISRSTIEKDLKAMKDDPEPGYYAPIRYDRQKCGYYYEDPEYSISNIQVEEEDIDAIEFAARILRQYRGFHMVRRYAEAIDRILDVVDVRRILSMEEFEEYVQFDTPVYMDGSGLLEPVIRAIKDKQVLSITHQSFSKTEPVTRVVHPYLLKEYQNRWYLVGLDEQENEIRTFGLDRIKKIDLTPGPSPTGEGSASLGAIPYMNVNFDPKAYFKHTIGIIAPQSKPPLLKIEFTKQQAQYLLTQPIHPSQKVLKETKDMVVFTFAVHPTYEFISLLLGYRDKVKVLSPMWLRKGMKELLEQMINKYQ